jgi:hypothetical protein
LDAAPFLSWLLAFGKAAALPAFGEAAAMLISTYLTQHVHSFLVTSM